MAEPKYTFYIDESGEPGIRKVRSTNGKGASPYMTLGAGFVRNQYKSTILETMESLQKLFDKEELHCSKLKHEQKVHYARTISTQRLQLFGLISHKPTLGSYKSTIDSSHTKFYNKCAQLLLERLGLFMQAHEIPASDVEIVFEEGDFNYNALKSLLRKCQTTPIRGPSMFLQNIDVDMIVAKPKKDEPLLQLADLVAHALYRCVDKSKGNYLISETRYLNELRSRFFCNRENGRIEGFGIKAVHNVQQLKLDPDTGRFLSQLSARQ